MTASDAELLAMLAARDQGFSAAHIARRMCTTRSAVLGGFKRINDECAKRPCGAIRPENRDGGMPERWWTAGLAVRGLA